ncbi:hypothetical protein [Lewinella sp. W8]|uniref:hypothetical protein n=1 Tax=Lewinella sp. W8 TaxID=2528208 RepID=UPI0010686832|nr:hypothetical protein [Lewinella sp. W8]MTB51705.1 hypothetical protein [Lewinella sp. W8]
MTKVNFKETQRYDNKLIPLLLGLIGVVTMVRGTSLLIAPEPKIWGAIFLFSVAAAIGGLIWWLTQLKLKVVVTEKNVKFKLSPLHEKKHSISWEEIDKCAIVRTSEVAQWGGGNITFNHEKRYSLTGRNGLSIRTRAGELFFIGCTDLTRLQETLNKMSIGS